MVEIDGLTTEGLAVLMANIVVDVAKRTSEAKFLLRFTKELGKLINC